MSTEDRCERMELFMLFRQKLQLLWEAVSLGSHLRLYSSEDSLDIPNP